MDIDKIKELLRDTNKTVSEATKAIKGAMASFDQLQRLKGKEVKMTSSGVGAIGKPLLDYAESITKQIEEKFLVLLREKLPHLFGDTTWFHTFSGQILGMADQTVAGIGNAFELLQGQMPVIMGQSYAYIKSGATGTAQAVANAFQGAMNNTRFNWTTGFSQLTESVVNGCKKLVEYLGGDFRQNVKNAMDFPVSKLPNVLNGMVGSLGGALANMLGGTLPIPHLAEGAVLPANKPFLAVLGDQKSGTNVEAPLSVIQDAVAAVTGGQTQAILAGFQASVDVQRDILEAVLGIRIGDELLCDAYSRYSRKLAVMRGG